MEAPLKSYHGAFIKFIGKVWTGFSSFCFGQGGVGGHGSVLLDSVREWVGQAG